MSMWTDWFIADPSEAKAIAYITTEGASFDDWPHLQMQSVIESSLMALWGILKGTPGKWASLDSDCLVQIGDAGDEGIGEDGLSLVTNVDPMFINALAAVTEDQIPRLAMSWTFDESMGDWVRADAADMLRQMTDFARQAKAIKKPVLELVVV